MKEIINDPILWSNIINALVAFALPIILTLLFQAIMAAIGYFRTKTNNRYIGLAYDTLGSIVTDLYNTERKEIEKALSDGKISPEEKVRLFNLLKSRAIELCLSRLGPDITKALHESFIDIEKVLGSKVEEVLARMKSSIDK